MPTTNVTGTLAGIGREDHSTTSEYRIFGPPGTGKTTALAELIRRDAAMYGSDSILVTSFSRTAAAEIANCDLKIDPGHAGTLHAHCYAALGSPSIAEAHVSDSNRRNPTLAVTQTAQERRLAGESHFGDDPHKALPGDVLLQELNRLRGLMVHPNSWPARVRTFEHKWSQYKLKASLLDFTDLIETCFRDVSAAPGNPKCLYCDEAQDLNRLELSLLRKWGQRAAYHVFAFDDDQTIFTFTGATPEAILQTDIPGSHKVVLEQSHRVPAAVHTVADRLIRQVSRREPKVYRPRADGGRVVRLNGGYKAPELFLVQTVARHLDEGRTVMFLASSGYMLKPLQMVLRKNAIPFHNPKSESMRILESTPPRQPGLGRAPDFSASRRTSGLGRKGKGLDHQRTTAVD